MERSPNATWSAHSEEEQWCPRKPVETSEQDRARPSGDVRYRAQVAQA